MRRLLALIMLLGVAAAAFAALGLHNARVDPVVRRASFALPNWPAGAAPVAVALVSDIHLGSHAMDEPRLARIVVQVNALHPDLIMLAGDFVNGHQLGSAAVIAAPIARELAKLRTPLGVIAVIGNHDRWTGMHDVVRALTVARITVLENAAIRRGPLAIGGVGDAYTHHDRTAATVAQTLRLGGAPLIVTHSPDIAPLLGAATPLLFAGHTHCGQWVLPLIGGPTVPSRYGQRYRCGVVRDGVRTVVVTGGVGTSLLPMRFGAPPDVWLVTLGPARGS